MLAPLLLAALAAAATPRALRVDYFHSGTAAEEHFALDRVVLEPLPFPGNPDRPIDETNLGKYAFEIRDRATNRLLYSRGFASIYGEWETTAEAKDRWRTFHESLRFPRPERPVQVIVKKRDARNLFREVWTALVDPADPAVDGSRPPSPGPVIEIVKSGPPERKLDLLLLCDGYTAAERGKFEKDARRLLAALLAQPPFRERRGDLNVWALCPAAEERGVSRPSTGVHRASPLGATYDAFGSERYVLTFENRRVREVASFAPYAALADEYFTSESAYLPAAEHVEPWEPNITALLDPAALKWKALVAPGVPIPTPWRAEAFAARAKEYQDKRKRLRAERRPESELDVLFTAQQKEETAFLAAEPYAGRVGAFEGANYEPHGFFRPQADCIMFSRDPVPFCAVCRGALGEILDLYSRP